MFPFVKKVMNNTINKDYFIEKVVVEAWRDTRINYFANNNATFYIILISCFVFDIYRF